MKAIDVAVLKTLAYADIFDQAMSESELRRLLIEHKTKASMAPDVRTVKGEDGDTHICSINVCMRHGEI